MVYLKPQHDTTTSTKVYCVSPGNLRRVPRHVETVDPQPVGHVVVLAAPAPELVGEPVDKFEMFDADGRDSSEVGFVRELVVELVHGN